MKATINYISENHDFILLITEKVNEEVSNFMESIKEKKTNTPLHINVVDLKCQKYSSKEILFTAKICFVFDAFTSEINTRKVVGLCLDNNKEENLIIKKILDVLKEEEEEREKKHELEEIKRNKEKKEKEKKNIDIEQKLVNFIYKENKEYLVGLKENNFEWKDLAKESYVNKLLESVKMTVNTDLKSITRTPSKKELDELISVKNILSKINEITLLKIGFAKDDYDNIFIEANILIEELDYSTYVIK